MLSVNGAIPNRDAGEGRSTQKEPASDPKDPCVPEKTRTPMAESHARGYRVPCAGEKEPRSDEKEPSVALLSAKRRPFSPTRDAERAVLGSLEMTRGALGSHTRLS